MQMSIVSSQGKAVFLGEAPVLLVDVAHSMYHATAIAIPPVLQR